MNNLFLLDLRSLIVSCQYWKKGTNTTLILVLSLLVRSSTSGAAVGCGYSPLPTRGTHMAPSWSSGQSADTHEISFFNNNYTHKKDDKIFLIYKEIQNGSVEKSHITNGLHIYGEIFVHILIYQEALSHI
jgi:hypothetical protein